MTRYRKLKSPPVPEKKAGVYGVFVGVCVMALLLSGSVMGLATVASGQTFTDLVKENAVNWKVKDVSTHTNTGAVQIWDYRFPTSTEDGALEVEFLDAAEGWFTVYVNNVWEGDLTGMKIRAVFEIRTSSADEPVFVARLPDSEVQLRLQFQTTGGAYVPTDLWWSDKDMVVLTSYTMVDKYTAVDPVTDSGILNTELVLEVPMMPDLWSNHDGIDGSDIQEEFSAAIANIHEIGFSLGRSGSLASGVALTQGDATFVLKSFELVPVEIP
jgi:hypothetical protein